MDSHSRKQKEWDEQSLSTADPSAQVCRPMDPESVGVLVEDIRAKLKLRPGLGAILDVGCGNGLLLEQLAGDFQTLAGVDYSADMVKHARERLEGRFEQGEAAKLSFADHSFDRVLGYSIFLYFPSEDYALEAVREMGRVLAPGGVALIGDLLDQTKEAEIKGGSNLEYEKKIPLIQRYSEWRFFDLERLVRYMRDSGFEAEMLEQPESFRLRRYRKDLRICRPEN